MAILTIILLHIFGLIKLKFTAWPEMLLWPYLMLDGWLPYKDIAIAHTPNLIVALKAFFALFGVGIMQLKVFSWILVLISDLLFLFVVRSMLVKENKKQKKLKLILAALSFVIWQLYFDGNGLWFELALLPLSIILFFLVNKKEYFWSGVIFAFAFFTKQTAVWFLMPIFYSLIQSQGKIRQSLIKIVSGSAAVFGIYIVIFYINGFVSDFYKWALEFGIFTLPRSQGQIQFPSLKPLLVSLFPFTVFIPLLLRKDKKLFSLFLWAFAGGFAAYPRFEYFHFQTAVPFLAIATSTFFTQKSRALHEKYFSFVYVLVAVFLFCSFFIRNISEGVRFYDADVGELQNYIQRNTANGDRIFVMNYWDILYPLTGTYPATRPWVPQLAWYLSLPGVENQMTENLAETHPKLIILNRYTDSGLSSYVPTSLYEHVLKNYKFKEKVAGMDVFVPQ